MKGSIRLASDRIWQAVAKVLLLAAAAMGMYVALGGNVGVIEFLFFGACLFINEVRTRTALDQSGPMMTVFWVFLFIAIPAMYLFLKLAWPNLHIVEPIPVEPVIIALAVPFQIFAAYVPTIPKAQHLVLAFVLVEAILGARSKTAEVAPQFLLYTLVLVGVCLVAGHITAGTAKARANLNRHAKRRPHGGRMLRPGAAILISRAGLAAAVCAVIVFVAAPRFTEPQRQPPKPLHGLVNQLPPTGEAPSFPDDPSIPPELGENPSQGATSVSGLSRSVTLGDFGTILRDPTPVARASLTLVGGATLPSELGNTPLFKAASLTTFDGETWTAPGRESVGDESHWMSIPIGLPKSVISSNNSPPFVMVETKVTMLALPTTTPFQVLVPGRLEEIRNVSLGPNDTRLRGTVVFDGVPNGIGDAKAEMLSVSEEARVWPHRSDFHVQGYTVVASMQPPVGSLPAAMGAIVGGTDVFAYPREWRYYLDKNWNEQRRFMSASRSPLRLAKQLEEWFKYQGGFKYSLEQRPSSLLAFIVDPTQRVGHCEYYATAMAILLRHFGHASRLCIGYAPKTKLDRTGEWQLRNSDAHAWVEVLTPDLGWIALDPTAASDPNARETELSSEKKENGAKDDEAGLDLFGLIGEFTDEHRKRAMEWLASAATSIGDGVASVLGAPWELVPESMRPRSAWVRAGLTLGVLAVLGWVAWRWSRRKLKRRKMVAKGMGGGKRARVMASDAHTARARGVWRELLEVLAEHGFVRARHQTPVEFGEVVVRLGGASFAPVALAASTYSELRYGRLDATQAEQLESTIRGAIEAVKQIELARRLSS